MVVEAECELADNKEEVEARLMAVKEESVELSANDFSHCLKCHGDVQVADVHYQLRHDLIELLWQLKGEED
jgi:hypothetical protein